MLGMGSCLWIEFEDDSIRHNPFEVNCSISKLFSCVSLDIPNDANNSPNTRDEDLLAELRNLREEIPRHRERISELQTERNGSIASSLGFDVDIKVTIRDALQFEQNEQYPRLRNESVKL